MAMKITVTTPTGKVGGKVAAKLLDSGAEVTLVSGPVDLDPPGGCRTLRVETAEVCESRVLCSTSPGNTLNAT